MNERKAPTAVASFYIDADCHWIIALEVYIIATLVKTHLANLTQNTVGPISTTCSTAGGSPKKTGEDKFLLCYY